MAAKGVLVETNSWHKKVKPDVSRRKKAYEIFKKCVCNCIIHTLQYIYTYIYIYISYINIYIYIDIDIDIDIYIDIYIYIYHTVSRWMHQLPDQGNAETSTVTMLQNCQRRGVSVTRSWPKLSDAAVENFEISWWIEKETHPDQILLNSTSGKASRCFLAPL